jgi:hypothetical protein
MYGSGVEYQAIFYIDKQEWKDYTFKEWRVLQD